MESILAMIKSYVINLDHDMERLGFFSSHFNKLGLEFERIPAVDGRIFSEHDYLAFTRERPRHRKNWLRGQMGCFLSHYTAWHKIAQRDDRFCAVFEDDVHLSDDLQFILQDDSWIPDDTDIIRLDTSTNRIRLTQKPQLIHKNREVYGVKSTSWCTGGYLINRRTAQQLIELSPRHHEPSDILLYNHSESVLASRLEILQFNPALCVQDKLLERNKMTFSSNIESTEPEVVRSGISVQKNPLIYLRAIYRSLRGYKRVPFR